jgi:hypothetical protein
MHELRIDQRVQLSSTTKHKASALAGAFVFSRKLLCDVHGRAIRSIRRSCSPDIVYGRRIHMSIKVTVYTVRVKKKHGRKNEILDSLEDSGDFFQIVKDFLQANVNTHHDDQSAERTARIELVDVDEADRSIVGIIQVGAYGEAGHLVRAADGQLVFKKEREHADTSQFVFWLRITPERDEALLILGKSTRFGVKSAFVSLLKRSLQNLPKEFTLSANVFMQQETFEEFINEGDIQSIHFVRMGIMPNFEDNYDTGHGEVRGVSQLTFKVAKNGALPIKNKLRQLLHGAANIGDFYELDDFPVQNIKVDIRVGRKIRRVDFSRAIAEPIYELDEASEYDGDEARWNALRSAVKAFADEISEKLYAE